MSTGRERIFPWREGPAPLAAQARHLLLAATLMLAAALPAAPLAAQVRMSIATPQSVSPVAALNLRFLDGTTGAAVVPSDVAIAPPDGASPHAATQILSAAPGGRISLSLPRGSYLINIEVPGYRPFQAALDTSLETPVHISPFFLGRLRRSCGRRPSAPSDVGSRFRGRRFQWPAASRRRSFVGGSTGEDSLRCQRLFQPVSASASSRHTAVNCAESAV